MQAIEASGTEQNSTLSKLTPRLIEVLECIAQGFNNAAIAKQLHLSPRSVETYINIIYQELGVSDKPGIHARVKAALLYLEDVNNHKP